MIGFQIRKPINSKWILLKLNFFSKAFAIVSLLLVIMSSLGLTLSTIKELKIKNPMNDTQLKENPIFEAIEDVCIAWFSMEIIIRIWAAPNKKKFFTSILNIVDIIVILPYYMTIISEFYFSKKHTENIFIFSIFKTLRISR